MVVIHGTANIEEIKKVAAQILKEIGGDSNARNRKRD
jgi:hypothetical protein